MKNPILTTVVFVFLYLASFAQNVTLSGPTACNGAAVTGTWTVPCGVTSITVEIYGGGGGAGGGGGGSNGGLFNTRGGGGGGGGAYSSSTITVVTGAVFSYSIGAGGCGGSNGGDASSGGNGTAGGNTSFTGTDANSAAVNLLANGGARGTGGSGTNGNTGIGGAGGTASGGTTNTNGIAGSNGNGATGGAGGAGAGILGGAGGAITGAAGLIYGGGGAGGGDSQGGRGAQGGIIITYNGTVSIPDTPIITSGAATCTTIGTSTISNYDGTMTYVFTPAGPTVGVGGIINSMVTGTAYTVVASLSGCSSLASSSFSNANTTPPPITPSVTSIPPTCSSEGISNISNFNSAYTYSFSPTGPTVDGTGGISGIIVGTNYTVEANDGSCSSSQSASFTNLTALSTPETPTLLSTPATCLNDGNSTITNYNTNHSYTFNPSGPLVGVGGLISGMITGTSYTVTANDGSCNSLASNNFSNEALTPPPVSPSVSTISPTCTADGVSTIGNYNPNFTYQFSPTGPTVSTAGIILNMTAGTSYTVVANDGSCNSIVSTAFSNAEQLPAPIPEITGELTYCTGSNTTLTASGGTSYSWSSSTTAVIGTNASITLTQGLYTLTATNANGCSASINTIVSEVSLPPAPQLTASPVNCPGDILTLSAEIELGNQIVWSGPNGFSSNEINVTLPISNNDVGVYQAYQFSSPTCLSTISTINVQINNVYSFDDFNFPNVITANNDGINDVLDIENIYKTCDTYSIYFFNRWGTLVYNHKLGETPFNGKDANGNELADGTYFYKLEFYSGGEQQTITKSGFIQLLR
jgi:gliding motility-associated-like protein